MARPNSVWWNKQKQTWCVEIEGKRFTLAKGRTKKSEAVKALAAILRERALLAKVDGAISVAGLCERFLVDTEERLSSGTLESYTYSCQKLVDELGDRPAHTICREDISKFTRTLRRTLNDSSIGIVLRSVQRCFNWGVEERIIPPHDLGRIRKPRSLMRPRLVILVGLKVGAKAASAVSHYQPVNANSKSLGRNCDGSLCIGLAFKRPKHSAIHSSPLHLELAIFFRNLFDAVDASIWLQCIRK